MVMVFQCLFKNPKFQLSHLQFSATDPPQYGQQLHWPAPQGGRHHRHQFCWHGSRTHKVPAILPPFGLHLLYQETKDNLAEEFRHLTLVFDVDFEILYQCDQCQKVLGYKTHKECVFEAIKMLIASKNMGHFDIQSSFFKKLA